MSALSHGVRTIVRVLAVLLVLPSGAALAETKSNVVKIAVLTSLGGAHEPYGRAFLDGIELAVEEANANRSGPRVTLQVFNDRGDEQGAREAAKQAAASEAHAVVGPAYSITSLAAGRILSEAGLASIVSTAESDLVITSPTTFHANFRNSDIGQSFADYLRHVLGGKRAAIVAVDNVYGRTIADGFRRGAERQGIATTSYVFRDAAGRDEAARRIAADPDRPAVVLAMLDTDAVPLVTILRRQGHTGPMFGGTAVAETAFAGLFAKEPEEARRRGFFADGIYAAVPVMLDSANTRTLEFADRYRARHGNDRSPTWGAVQGYDAGRLAVAAVWRAARERPSGDTAVRRAEALKFLASLDGPDRSVMGVLGPIWFMPDRSRQLPIRVGRFNAGRFESAPLQIVPAPLASAEEIASGAVFDLGDGRHGRLQQVVYTGIFVNEIQRLDVAQSTFTADLYVWMRFVRDAAVREADPTQIEFPDMVRGGFDESRPVAKRELADGSIYRLWRVRGDFKNDFDLHRYPADQQTLKIRLYNAGAAANRVVYAVDRNALDLQAAGLVPGARRLDTFGGVAAAVAFRNLSQWQPLRVIQARDNLVTQSALGDPAGTSVAQVREWSGFMLQIDVQRRLGTTVIKTLLPIGLMTAILFATLFFPPGLATARVTVAITAGLSGTVLLAAINAQLGNVGYVIIVEYGFYVFFALCLTCIVTLVVAEQRRLAGKSAVAVERAGRYAFAAMFVATTIAAIVAI